MFTPEEMTSLCTIVLQVDATVIAGILILLTIRSFVYETDKIKIREIIKPNWAVSFVGSPFAGSAIFALMTLGNTKSPNSETIADLSISLAVIGFLYMIIVFAKLYLIEMPEIQPEKLPRIARWRYYRNRKKKQKEMREKIKKEMGKIRERYRKIFEEL